MKLKLLQLSILTASLAIAAPVARAQNIVPGPASQGGSLSTNITAQGFLGTAFDYVTQFNPSLTNTFSTNRNFAAWTGMAYQSSINLGADLGLEAKPFPGAHGLQLRSVSTFGAVAGTVADQEVDIGWAIDHVDTEISVFAGGDYDAENHAEHLVIGAEIKKALTDNTFAGGAIEGKFLGTRNSEPVIILFAGFTF